MDVQIELEPSSGTQYADMHVPLSVLHSVIWLFKKKKDTFLLCIAS